MPDTVKPRPTDVTLNKRDGFLQITWNIGNEVSVFPLPQLREACPCVECRGGHAKMGPAYDPDDLLTIPLTPARSYGVQAIDLVGNYAIAPTWEDGHSTGIYTWEFLYKIRPQDDATP